MAPSSRDNTRRVKCMGQANLLGLMARSMRGIGSTIKYQVEVNTHWLMSKKT